MKRNLFVLLAVLVLSACTVPSLVEIFPFLASKDTDFVEYCGDVPDGGHSVICTQSDPGDYIGGGKPFLAENLGQTFTLSRVGERLYTFSGAGWHVIIEAPSGEAIRPKFYRDARRSASREFPGLDVSSPGRGCNQLIGEFTVLEADEDEHGLMSLRLVFEQHCEGAEPALRGYIRFLPK